MMIPSRRIPALSAITVALVVTFLVLGWWQVTRAESGNIPSYVYAVMWPFFAGYAVYLRYALTHRRQTPVEHAPASTGPDEEVVRYNDYLASKRAATRLCRTEAACAGAARTEQRAAPDGPAAFDRGVAHRQPGQRPDDQCGDRGPW